MTRKISITAAMLTALGLGSSPTAHASILDRPSLSVSPVIILWAANDVTGEAPVVTDFIVQGTSGVSTDLIDIDGRTVAAVSGNLIPTTDAAYTSNSLANFRVMGSPTTPIIAIDTDALSSFDAFELNSATVMRTNNGLSYSSDFFIASNTPFNITTNVTEVQTSGDFDLSDVLFYFIVQRTDTNAPVPFGASARDPGGVSVQLQSLADLDGVDILQSARSTAASNGSIADQSVKMQLYYEIANGQQINLSHGYGTVIADVTYTAYVP